MLRRHDLLRVTVSGWDALLRGNPTLADTPLVAGWAQQGFPVVVRRRLCADPADAVPVALPLPPSHGKRRIAFTLPHGEALALPPVLLRDAAATAPREWQDVIVALLRLGDSLGVTPCVFGALMWEHVTGLPYLTARSDLDLIWPVPDGPLPSRLLAELLRLDAASPVRLDGEIILPDGRAVNWREMAQASEAGGPVPVDVLVKSMDGVATGPLAELFALPALAS